tara:strand:- start:1121 stop:1525 length:405 start_codon:yes stop_codon:yes gene_type:complete
MRVNISYSVELDDVPKKLAAFLEEAQDQITEAEDLLNNAIGSLGAMNYTTALDGIKSYREAMGTIDFRLEDVMHILSGYTKTLTELAHPTETGTEAKPSAGAPPPSPQQVEWVQQELQKLQEKKNDVKPEQEDG